MWREAHRGIAAAPGLGTTAGNLLHNRFAREPPSMPDRQPTLPQYQRLGQQLRDAIEQAALPEGSRLPSVRLLAAQHRVSLTTALQALRWLEASGAIHARPRSGYYVSAPPAPAKGKPGGRRGASHGATTRPARWAGAVPELDAQARDHLAMVGAPCEFQLDLAAGEPSLYPVERFGVLMRRLAYRDRDLLGAYVRGTGHPALRGEIARHAMQYRCELDPDELIVTNGCVEALNLALRATTRPGDVVAVESPSYFGMLQMLRALELVPLPVACTPGQGIDLAALADALGRAPVKAVVTIANGHNPVGSVAPDAAKRALVALLAEHDVPLIEDDIFGDLCFGETRPLPVRAFDPGGNVLLCAGFSKSLCPGLRLGWIAAGRYTEKVKALKFTTSMGTAELQQAAVAEMLASGGYALHLRRLKAALQAQQASLRAAILRHFPAGTEVSRPEGGFVLWVKLPAHGARTFSTRVLFERARAEGIGIAPGHLFGVNGAFDDCLRVNAGYRWSAALDGAIARLGGLAREIAAPG